MDGFMEAIPGDADAFKEETDPKYSYSFDEEMGNSRDWVGASMSDIYKGHSPWEFEIPMVHPSKYHAVLYDGPPNLQSPPKPRKSLQLRHWENDFVRLPYSPKNLFPIKTPTGEDCLTERWSLIKEALTKHPITSSEDLEEAVHSYNTRLPKFNALHFYFNEVLEDYEADAFFQTVLPGIIQLALQMPTMISASIPLLKKESNRDVTLTQMQIACLLANAFLCTFPWRRDMATYPGVNFVRLFSAHLTDEKFNPVSEKLKCISHYFRKILQKPKNGVVTFKRKYMPRNHMPRWDRLENKFLNTQLRISSGGTIEDNGNGLLQVDFANKYVGGGVLGFGCVQEEIRFVINPELIVSRLFTEQLGNTESLVIIGAERYSNYSGYAETFTWNGNCDDETPYDGSGRRQTTIVAVDAQYFTKSIEQFDMSSILREVNKAYIGFSSRRPYQLPAVATGNWGCGAFRGNPQLKFLVQLMACSASHRDMVYFTFGDDKLRDTLFSMYNFLVTNEITCAQLWRLIHKFTLSKIPPDQFYPFLQQAFFDSKNQLSIKQFFFSSKKTKSPEEPCTSTEAKITLSQTFSKVQTSDNFIVDMSNVDIVEELASSMEEDALQTHKKFKQNSKTEKMPSLEKQEEGRKSSNGSEISQIADEKLISIIDAIDGETFSKTEPNFNQSFLSALDEVAKTKKTCQESNETDENLNESMDIEDVLEFLSKDATNEAPTSPEIASTSKRKITDYFTREKKF